MDQNPYEPPRADLIDPPPPGSGGEPDFLSQLIGTLTLLALFVVFLACAGTVVWLLMPVPPRQ